MRKVWTRGLLLLLLAGLVTVGCSSKAPPSWEPPPPGDNVCGWPDYCHPESARMMLRIVQDLVDADKNAGQIDAVLHDRVSDAIQRCLGPQLTNAAGKQVCHLQDPLPCDELRVIKEHAEDPSYPLDPKNPKFPNGQPATPAGHWGTIARELESFPTGS